MSGHVGFEDRFWVDQLGPIADANSAVGSDENIPGVDFETEEGVRVFGPVVAVKQIIDGVSIDELEQWREVDRLDSGSFRDCIDDDFRDGRIGISPISGIDDWRTPPIDD